MLGREPRTEFSALVGEDEEGVQVEPVNEAELREQVKSIIDTQEGLHRSVPVQVAANCKSIRGHASRRESCCISLWRITCC